MKYRKKPVEIEACQFDDPNFGVWAYEHGLDLSACDLMTGKLVIETLEGDHLAGPGDWIIKGVKGEFYPCKPDIFEMTYEKVADES